MLSHGALVRGCASAQKPARLAPPRLPSLSSRAAHSRPRGGGGMPLPSLHRRGAAAIPRGLRQQRQQQQRQQRAWAPRAAFGARVAARSFFAARSNWYPKKKNRTTFDGSSRGRWPFLQPAPLAILLANLAVYALYDRINRSVFPPSFELFGRRVRMSLAWFFRHFGLSSESFVSRRWWTALTSAFAHRDLIVFGINMLAFVLLTSPLVGLGTGGFLTLYGLSALTASCASLVLTHRHFNKGFHVHNKEPTMGASGAIAGMLAYYCALYPRSRIMLFGVVPIPAIAVLALAYAVSGTYYASDMPSHYDHGAHLGGLTAGIAFCLLTRGRPF